MGRVRRWSTSHSAVVAVLLAVDATAVAQAEFPFDRELLLDARPLPGSKRVPILEIGADGRAQVDLWCRGGPAQVDVTGETIKFTLGAMREEACTPDRARRDDELAAALAQVTGWRTEDDIIVFAGPTELRFVPSAH
jgi:META domain